MTAPSMTEVLAKHAARWDHDESYYMPVACECGVERPDGPGSDELWHAAHVAQALAAAGFGHVASVERERDAYREAVEASTRELNACGFDHGNGRSALLALAAAARKARDEWERNSRNWQRRAEAAEAQVAAVRDVLAEHWDWKAGRVLRAAVSAALDGEGGR